MMRNRSALLLILCIFVGLAACSQPNETVNASEVLETQGISREKLSILANIGPRLALQTCETMTDCVAVHGSGVYAAAITVGSMPDGKVRDAILVDPGGPGNSFDDRLAAVSAMFEKIPGTYVVLSEPWSSLEISPDCLITNGLGQPAGNSDACKELSTFSKAEQVDLFQNAEDMLKLDVVGAVAVSFGINSIFPFLEANPEIPLLAIAPAPSPNTPLNEVLSKRASLVEVSSYPELDHDDLVFAAIGASYSVSTFSQFQQILDGVDSDSVRRQVSQIANRSRYLMAGGYPLPQGIGHAKAMCQTYPIDKDFVPIAESESILLSFYNCERFSNLVKEERGSSVNRLANPICLYQNMQDLVVPEFSAGSWNRYFVNVGIRYYSSDAHGDLPDDWESLVLNLHKAKERC